MRNQTQMLKQRLVMQGHDLVMVSAGEVAFLNGHSVSFEDDPAWKSTVIKALGFLQSGSPEVRIFSEYLEDCEKNKNREGFTQFESGINNFLFCLCMGLDFKVRAEVRMGSGLLLLERVKIRS